MFSTRYVDTSLDARQQQVQMLFVLETEVKRLCCCGFKTNGTHHCVKHDGLF